MTPHTGQLGYDDFDTGLVGELFPGPAHSSCSLQTFNNATCSGQWDPGAGQTCPGALQLSTAFKAYASGSAADE